jgi:hypothetical protein
MEVFSVLKPDISRRGVLAALTAALLSSVSAKAGSFAMFQIGNTTISTSAQWAILPIGPGGNVLGINFANDGTGVCRTDTGGCYVNSIASPTWKQLITVASMPAGEAAIMADYDASHGGVQFYGSYAAAVAPSNSSIVYIWPITGKILVSSDGGNSFTLTGFTQVSVSVNAAQDSGWNEKLAVDPNNAAVVIAGHSTGTFFNTNTGSGAWTKITAVGTSSGQPGSLIAFDPSSTITGGKTQGIYIGTYGTGIYHGTGGTGGSFSLLNSTGMPTLPKQMACSGDGTLYVVANDGTRNIYKYNGTAWSTLTPFPQNPGGRNLQSVACDPANTSRIVALTDTGDVSESSDHGSTWSDSTTGPSRTATDVPWLATTAHTIFADSQGAFNPALSNTLFVADGIGVWKQNPVIYQSATSFTLPGGSSFTFTITGSPPASAFPLSSTVFFFSRANNANNGFGTVSSYNASTGALTLNFTGNSGSGAHTDWTFRGVSAYASEGAGVEQLVNTRVVVPPGGNPFISVWDRCGFFSPGPSTFPPNQAFIATSSEICGGWDADYSASTPSYLAAVFNSNIATFDTSGFSTDGGQTWTKFGSNTPWGSGSFIGGNIAVAGNSTSTSSTQNIVWMPGAGGGGGNNPYYTTNGGTTWSLCSFPVAVPTTGTTGWPTFGNNSRRVCADRSPTKLNTFYAYNGVTGATYISVNSGQTWTKQNSGTVSSHGIDYLKSVPKLGTTDTPGWLFGYNLQVGPLGSSDCLVRSKDGGVTWSVVNVNITAMAALGFGASVNGAVPAILIVANFNGVRGVYLSTDDGATWKNVSSGFVAADQIQDCDGDKSTTGIWYVTTSSSGVVRGVNIS